MSKTKKSDSIAGAVGFILRKTLAPFAMLSVCVLGLVGWSLNSAGSPASPPQPSNMAAEAPPTNGFYGSGTMRRIGSEGPHLVRLKLHLVFGSETNIERSFRLSMEFEGTNFMNGPAVVHDPSPNWMYFMATNSFPGPAELRDSSGALVPLRKPEVNTPEAYPAQYGLRTLWSHARRRCAFPCVLVPEEGTTASMPEFVFEDYFNIEKAGDYALTIWPRIYKRVAKGADICQRIDLPPVSVAIHWP